MIDVLFSYELKNFSRSFAPTNHLKRIPSQLKFERHTKNRR